MITIVTVDEAILDKAARVAGIRDKAALVRRSLESLIAGESARRLATLGGSEASIVNVPSRGAEAEDGRDEKGGLRRERPVVQ